MLRNTPERNVTQLLDSAGYNAYVLASLLVEETPALKEDVYQKIVADENLIARFHGSNDIQLAKLVSTFPEHKEDLLQKVNNAPFKIKAEKILKQNSQQLAETLRKYEGGSGEPEGFTKDTKETKLSDWHQTSQRSSLKASVQADNKETGMLTFTP